MNERVKQDWQVALDVLQPSETDLEHGLELHRQSLVFESYGFSPRGAVDGDALAVIQAAGATDEEFGEASENMFLARMADHADLAAEYHQALDFAGVDCILQNAGEECQDPLQLIKRLGNFTYLTDMLGEFMQRVPTPQAILDAHAAGKHGLYMSANGVPLAQRWKTVEEELRYVRVLFQLGVRMVHVTYNRRNMLGDGCEELTDVGLSDFGRAAIAELNRVGIIADVAHSGWQTGIDTAAMSSVPVVASHSGAHALSGHPRCKTDEVMRAIVDTGGTVGVCCIPAFLGGTGDISAFLDHIDYMVKLIGAESVTIGTDQAYVPPSNATERQKIPDRGRRRTRFEGFWQPDDPLNDPAWREPRMRQSLAWTNWPLFTVGMVQRGYSDDDIQKILGGNILRVTQEVFDGRQPL
ncbi:MAG: dipeptidase [Gemmatimonadetes bacterium]|jgi:membrane dipeptidase|nr:dipeptidase [Gemmatimonadota bacterium]MBT7859860.1 dipeptidase [Gemmatimonadota bacterium]